MSISCHVLDTSLGRPAAGLTVRLERHTPDDAWQLLGQGTTNADGRIPSFGAAALAPGQHRITFATGEYFARNGQPVFFPRVEVTFLVTSAAERYHIPLLLSPFGYSTYRGS